MPPLSLPTYRDDDGINVVVETPRGSTIKIKYDSATGMMMLSRPLPAGLRYPNDWGFVAGTRAPDGDPLDALVLWDRTSYPGLLVPSRAIGVLCVEQNAAAGGGRQRNDRLVVVPIKSPDASRLRSIDDVDQRMRSELEQFFRAAVAFENKDIGLLGWGGAEQANAAIKSSLT